MSAKVQVKRDSIEKGDDVRVKVSRGDREHHLIARVRSVHRAACRVVFPDNTERMIPLRQLERVEPVEPTPKPMPPTSTPDAPQRRPVATEPTRLPPAHFELIGEKTTAVQSPQSQDDVDAWLAMGADMIALIRTRIEALIVEERDHRAGADELRQSAHELDGLADNAAKQRKALQAKLKLVEGIAA